MALQEKIDRFMLEEKGIENTFKNLSWLTAAAVLFKVSLLLRNDSVVLCIITVLFSFFLFAIAIVWGQKIILIPLLSTFYGNMAKYSQMAYAGWKLIQNIQFWIYLLFSSLYCLLAISWFNAIAGIALK